MELLCIRSHSQKAVISGNSYLLISDKPPCNCRDIVNVGISVYKSPDYIGSEINECESCKVRYKNDGIWWLHKSLFAEIATEEEVNHSVCLTAAH